MLHGSVESPQSLPSIDLPALLFLLPRNELNDHLDTIDSNLDNLQTMLTTHGFSVDTSALLDVSVGPPDHGSDCHTARGSQVTQSQGVRG